MKANVDLFQCHKQTEPVYCTVDHHSLEYGPSNKNLFQTMGVFHTMGGQKNNFFLQFLKYLSIVKTCFYTMSMYCIFIKAYDNT